VLEAEPGAQAAGGGTQDPPGHGWVQIAQTGMLDGYRFLLGVGAG
jgi:hypothetical protein